MRTTLTICIDTNNMNKIYNDSDPEKFTTENEITEAMEEQIHQAIIQIIKSNLNEDTLEETILNDCIPEFQFLGVDEWDSLGDYGNIKITMENEGTQEKEILVNYLNNTPYDEVILKEETKNELKKAVEEDAEFKPEVKEEEEDSDEEDN